MTTLTKMDIKAIRAGNDITVHLNKEKDDGTVRIVKRKPYFTTDPFAEDKYHTLTAQVVIYGSKAEAAVKTGAAWCFAMAGFYHDQKTETSFIMKSLREGDRVVFEFHPDYHNNTYVSQAQLHADALMMHVYRKEKLVARFELTTSVCPANSARMCNGVPNTSSFIRANEEARAA